MSSDTNGVRFGDKSMSRRINRTGETLHLIRTTPASTISDIAELMDVARSTVSERVERLLAHGLVRVVGAPIQGRGRPATSFEFDPSAGSILTAHVGITGMRSGVTDLAADLLDHRMDEIALSNGPEALCDRLIATFESLPLSASSASAPPLGIGIGLPGRIELAGISHGTDLWSTFPIVERLEEHFAIPCYVDRDVNMLALGEQAARNESKGVHICVKVGSAIGCGIAFDGQILEGSDGLAGEIGHTRVTGRSDPCTCGNEGCLNAVASGAALVEQLASSGFDVAHIRDVVALSNTGVAEATEAIRQAGRHIGQVLAGCVNLLNPRTISLWGYLLDADETLMAGINESMAAYAAPASARSLAIVSTRDGDTTGLRGAARLVTAHVLSPAAIDQRLNNADVRATASASSSLASR